MAKRFTATDKWEDAWFSELEAKYKLFWIYLLDKCDHAGIWEKNFKVANFFIGQEITEEEILKNFRERIIQISERKWFIPKFIEFQYIELKSNNQAHKNVIKILKNYNLIDEEGALKGLSSSYKGAKEKDKEKEEDKEEEMEGGMGETNSEVEQASEYFLEPIESRKSMYGGPSFEEVKYFFCELNKRPDEEAVNFWNDYEGKKWWVLNKDGPSRRLKTTRDWQLKAEQWIQKNRMKETSNERHSGYKKGGASREELARLATEHYFEQR